MQNNINNNKHDAFSEIFRQKLENHTAPVAPESWDAIQAALKAKQPKRVVPLWWWFSGGAVAAAFLLLFTLQIFNQQTFEQGIAKRHIIHRTIMLQQKQLLAEDGVRAQALKVKNSKVSGSAEYINSTPGVTNESRLAETNETIQPAEIKQNNNEAVAVITEVDAIEEKTKNESASPSIEKTEIKQDDANTPALPEWEDPLKSKRNKNWGLIASVGSAGGASASSPKNVFSDMSGKMSIVRAATVNTSILTPSDFSDKTFFSPLSVGAKVSKHFGETFSLETGFSYTYLLTKFKSDNYNAALHLHYLGLPVQMVVKIWGNPKWKVYGSAGEWNVEIPLIISNHPDLQHVAERFGIPFYLFPITKETKEEQERKEMELLAKHKITFIVLARYMQVISEQMINAYPNKIINIHHSFLPAFVGAKPYHAAFQRGVKIIGATSHYVTTELDAGPIIEQDVVRITHKDAIEDLVNKGKDLEKIVLSRAVQKHIERKVLAYKNKTVIFS
jgi:formyltetrahydrofolate deformylase